MSQHALVILGSSKTNITQVGVISELSQFSIPLAMADTKRNLSSIEDGDTSDTSRQNSQLELRETDVVQPKDKSSSQQTLGWDHNQNKLTQIHRYLMTLQKL